MSPLRDVPKNIARSAEMLQALKAPIVQPTADLKIPVNLFYFDAVEAPQDDARSSEGVIYLEMLTSLTFAILKEGIKVAELTEANRQDLRERLKYHFGRLSID